MVKRYKYLAYFFLTFVFLSFIFRIFLSAIITNSYDKSLLFIVPITYTLSLIVLGFTLGKKQGRKTEKRRTGALFHIASFLGWNAVSYFWFYAGYPAASEKISHIYIVTICWAIGLAFHVLSSMKLKASYN